MQQPKFNQKRIIIVARIILMVAAATIGTMVFYIMKNHTEDLLRTSLQSSLQNHIVLAESEIRQAFEKSATVATRPFLIKQIALNNTTGDHPAALVALQRGAQSFLTTGLTAIALYDREGNQIVQAGHFMPTPELEVPIHFAKDSQLFYLKQFYLRTAIDIVDDGQVIGKVITETPLASLSRMFATDKHREMTSDLALCASSGDSRMNCFPTTLNTSVLNLPDTTPKGVPLPMSYALHGKTGFIVTQDYRRREVVAAYSPVGHLGLGMVLKMDSAELYAPVWSQLRYLLPLMIILLGAALLSLRWLLAPLVNELVRSEKEAREANARLQDSENHIRLLLDNADEGIVSIGATGTIELFNPAAERIFQYQSADVLGKNISMLMPEPDASTHDEHLQRYLKTKEAHVIGTVRTVDALRSNGEVFPIELRVSEFSLHGVRKFIGIMHDITDRKAAEAKIIHLAHYDALTDLPNRRLVQDRIQNTIARVRRTQTPFAVMFVDLNRFKEINDTLGHDAGDQLLKVVAQRLSASLRAEDTVGRQGGDEFIVLLANLSAPHDSAFVAQKIIDTLAEPIEIHGQIILPSASVGIAVYPQDGDDVDSLLKHSDQAMYLAKDSGRGVYRFYGQAPNAQSDTE